MAGSGYVKIYGSILGSSVWAEAPATRIVWITMLALADQNGRVEASVGGLARFANVSPRQCAAALDILSAPDPDSKSPEHEGRRIEKAERGWLILNYLAYREMQSPKQVADAVRAQTYRDRKQAERDASRASQPVAATVDEAVTVAVDPSSSAREDVDRLLNGLPTPEAVTSWQAEIAAAKQGMHGDPLTDEQIARACRDYVGNGHLAQPSLRHFRGFLRDAGKPARPRSTESVGDQLDRWAATPENQERKRA